MVHATFLALLSELDVERAALAHAPAIAEARARVAEREALLGVAQSAGLPHAYANYAQSPQSGTVGTVEQRLTTAGAQIVLGDVVGRGPVIAQARADLRSARADELNAERNERIRSVGLYFDAVRTGDIRRLREAIVQAGEADVRAAKLRFEAGAAPRLDVVRADVTLARAHADLARARAEESNARHTLALEIAVDPRTLELPTLATTGTPAGLSAPPDADRAVAVALNHRPEIAAARDAVASEEAAVRVAARLGLPSLTAQVGYTTGVDTGVRVSGPSANVTVDLPLSHGASDRVRAEKARLDQAQARFSAQQRSIQVEVGDAVRSYVAAVEAAAAATRAREEALAEVRAIQAGYRAGASSSLDLEDARRTYAQAAVDEAVALSAQRQAAATLAAVMGIE